MFKVAIAKRLPRGVVLKLRNAAGCGSHGSQKGKGSYRRKDFRREMQRDMNRL